MGVMDFVKDQFIDVIEYIDESDKVIVCKHDRTNNEIKQGAKVIVRESQTGVFLKGGQLADVLYAGTYSLNTDNLPVLSTLRAFAFGFNSPIKADLYFVSLKQFVNNKWGTQNPIMLRDKEFNLVRVRAFGTFAFRITNVVNFMKEIFGTQRKVMTYDIVQYLTSFATEAVAISIAECNIPVIDLAIRYRDLGDAIKEKVNERSNLIGIEFTEVVIENISLPEEVEKLIDEQSGIGMASKDMQTFMQYQSARAMRDAAQQTGGLAGLGAGFALGNNMASVVKEASEVVKVKCPACGVLNDEKSKFCNDCGQKISGKNICPSCKVEAVAGAKFCNECGCKL